MAGRGRDALKLEQKIMGILSEGPIDKVSMCRALNWSVFGENRALDSVLQRLRAAGMIEPVKQKKGFWQIKAGKIVCPCCQGQGICDEHQSAAG